MPSFSEIVGVVVTFIVLSTASGHGDIVWKVIGEVRRVAVSNARQEWGCPSIANRGACDLYDSRRYW
jgi:hypothetical protein